MLRASDYTHLCEILADAGMNTNEVQAWTKTSENSEKDIGRLVVLLSTHIGNDRYMRQKIHDIIAISNNIGHRDVFITMTCNPHWPQIHSELFPGQRSEDRPDLCDRVFRMKLKLLLAYLKDASPFGCVLAYVSVTEFQKKGLVHAHIILFLYQPAKFSLQDPLKLDTFILPEIPPNSTPELRNTVLRHMIHKPCTFYSLAPCVKDGKCSERFPKPLRSETSAIEVDYYVTYKSQAQKTEVNLIKYPLRRAVQLSSSK